ncbi:MAG TPA: EAL domain-containing protein [Candidatus Limnocylindria bacterium]|nr:EAL domain-containing protein [Candidatus Limnocylindria bacterium]
MSLAKRLILPDDTLERVRTVYLGLTFGVAAPYAVGLLLSGQPMTSQAVGLLTLAALMTYRIAGYRRGGFPVLGDPLEVVATVVLAWAIGDSTRPLPILFLGLNFRAFYGSTRSTVAVTMLYAASVVVAAAIVPGDSNPFASAFTLVPTVLLNGGFANFLKTTLRGKASLERSLRHSEARFRALVQNSADVILVVGPDGVVGFHTSSASSLLGAGEHGLVGRRLADLVHPDDAASVDAVLQNALVAPGGSLELRLLHGDGAMWVHVEALLGGSIEGEIAGTVLTLRDVTQRKALEHRLRYEAVHDSLTQLPNRAEMQRGLSEAIAIASTVGNPLGVLFIDLDDFKAVNDTLGHSAGDQLLVAVARRIRTAVHADDLVARLGGDEFAVLVGRLRTPHDAATVAQRVLAAIQPPFMVAGQEVYVRASIGIATTDGSDGAAAEELIRRADTAMYAAKGHGKGRVEVFESAMGDAVERRLAIEADLRRGIAEEELFLEFQPIVRLADRGLVAAEALVRWRHPVRGVVPPLDFIELAESAGLAVPLSRLVIERAVRTLAEFRRAATTPAEFSMGVNLSARQLLDDGLTTFLSGAIAHHDVAPGSLMIEVTETVLMQDAPEIRKRLMELRKLGVRLALDDFGTGYTSLAYLHDFPIDVLKIDRTFVRDLGLDPKKTALARSIIRLSQELGFDTVPEGIETETQRALLQSYGAEIGQGYLFGRPAGVTDFIRLHIAKAGEGHVRARGAMSMIPSPSSARP